MMASSLTRHPCRVWVLLVGFFAIATALPVEVELEKRAISNDVYQRLNFFSQYSAAAYCAENNNSTGTKLVCPQGNCPLVEAADTYTLTEFENSIATDVTGFVATDTTNKLIVVSFRGSRSLRNWLTDLEFPTVSTTICATCVASTGFWSSWQEAQDHVLTAVAAGVKQYPDFKIIITGHSLGGALATLGAGVLRNNGYNVDLYTYGSPKVGLESLATSISSTTHGANYRATHKNDPIPRLPPWQIDFRHVSPEYYITTDDTTIPTANDIDEYTGTLEFSGNEGNTAIDVSAHTFYFGPISACDGSEQLELKREVEEENDLVQRIKEALAVRKRNNTDGN